MTAGKLKTLSAPTAPWWPKALRLVCGPWLALPCPTGPGFPVGAPDTTAHSPFSLWILSNSVPSLYLIGDFAPPHSPLFKTLSPPSSQLYHRPVISFCVDPYICTSSPGEGVPLTYNPDLGPRNEGGSGGELVFSQLPEPLGSSSLLLPSFRTMPAQLLLCPVHAPPEADVVQQTWLPWSVFPISLAYVNRM